MDVSALHDLHEDLSEYLSEVTVSDLRRPAPAVIGDIGDLFLHILDQNLTSTEALTGRAASTFLRPDRASLGAVVGNYGSCGLEARYRQTIRFLEDAFTTATDPSRLCEVRGLADPIDVASLYEQHIVDTVLHTWDIAHALGLGYRPTPALAQRALRAIAVHVARTSIPVGAATAADQNATFDRLIVLSGRGNTARPSHI